MNWLVEEYDDHVKDLVVEIRKQGHTCDFINYYKMVQDPNYMGQGLPKGCGEFDGSQPALFYGSIQLANWIFRHKPEWIPGVWYNYDKYKVSHWSAKLGKYMLNDAFYILPKGEVTRRGPELFWSDSEGDYMKDLFIRPDNGTKSFGGKVFARETWIKDWDNASHMMDDHELCVISNAFNVLKEWRFIVAEGKVLTGSVYKIKGSAEIEALTDSEEDKKAWEFTQKIADEGYNPDPMYTIDVCRCGPHFYLMELNNFCCSGLYACDLEKIVAKASELAIKEYEDLVMRKL